MLMDIAERLNGIEADMRRGERQRARDDLTAFSETPEAVACMGRVAELFVDMKELGLAEAFLDRVNSDPESAVARQFPLELRVVDEYIAKGMRREAFHRLQKLVPAARNSPADFERVAEKLSVIGEDSLALEIFQQLEKLKPKDVDIKRKRLRSLCFVREEEGFEQLEEFLKEQQSKFEDWELAADIYHNRWNPDKCLNAAWRALSLGGDAFRCYDLIVQSWMRKKNPRRAATEIKKIPLDRIKSKNRFRHFAELAFKCGDTSTAIKIAKELWSLDNKDPSGAFIFFRYLIAAKRGADARHVLTELFHLLDANGWMDGKSFARLAELCFEGFRSPELELRALDAGLRRHPDDERLLAAKRQYLARQQFMAGRPKRDRATSRSGLLGRLCRRFAGGGSSTT
jgi:tetratricopeptide (TPR) repeat protein